MTAHLKMELFVPLGNNSQPLINFTQNSGLGVAGALLPLWNTMTCSENLTQSVLKLSKGLELQFAALLKMNCFTCCVIKVFQGFSFSVTQELGICNGSGQL